MSSAGPQSRPAATSAPPPAAPPPAASSPAPPPTDSHWHPPPHSVRAAVLIVGIGLVGMCCILAAWHIWPFISAVEHTEDAYVRGNTTVISPQVSGYVTRVLVRDFDTARSGQLLVTIDDRIYAARVREAQAALDAAVAALANSIQAERARRAGLLFQNAAIKNSEALLARAMADARRVDDLVTDGSVSFREQDQTNASLKQAYAALDQAKASHVIADEDIRTVIVGRDALRAAVESARAALDLARTNLTYTRIVAPVDGQLSEVAVREGQYVTNGTQLFFLIPPHPWVVANYKEAQTSAMRVGQPVRFRVDALAGGILYGHIDSLSPAAGSEFTVLKPDNATGNFTKVPQRIAVHVLVDPRQPLAVRLRPGMSVETEIDTSQ
jgi:multidrug resistance efflux pump